MHRSLKLEVRTKVRPERDYLKSMRLWTNFFANSGAEISLIKEKVNLPTAQVLEMGCGNGRLTHQLALYARHVVGIDLDERLIEFADAHAASVEIPNLKFLKMSGEELGFPDQSFDLVVLPWMLHMVQNKEALLKEAKRVLKPQGKLIAFCLYGDCDYDRIARYFIGTRDREMNPVELYEKPLNQVFGVFEKIELPENKSDYSFVFPDCGVTAEAFTFAFENWYEYKLKEQERGRLRHLIQSYRLGNHIELKTRGAIYTVCR